MIIYNLIVEKKPLELVDKSVWTSLHTLMFFSLAVGYFMWGVISSIAPLIYPSINNILFLLMPTFATLAGDLILPFFSDNRLGRKTTFFITMGLYSAGTALLILAAVLAGFNTNNLANIPYLLLIILGIVLGILGVEGEVPVMLSYTAEMMPLKYRDQMLILAPNFDNIGAMVAALIGYITYSASDSFAIELLSIGLVAALGIITAIIIRLLLPESVRWLTVKGKVYEAEREVERLVRRVNEIKEKEVEKEISLGFSYLFLALIGVSQYLTYGLMAFYVADFYFQGSTLAFIVFIANLGASITGFIATYIINKVKTRVFTLFSYIGGTLSMVPIILLTMNFNLVMFYVLLVINMLFSEFGWAVRTVYEPVLMPSKLRAFMIGLIRIVPITMSAISVYALSVYLSNNLALYLVYSFILWAIGGVMSIIWYFEGIDVNFVSIEKIHGEKRPVP